jgi:hypothetical protein
MNFRMMLGDNCRYRGQWMLKTGLRVRGMKDYSLSALED